MNPPPTYHQLLRHLQQAKSENLELKQNLDTCKQTCELYKKAYTHVKQNELKLSIIVNKLQSNL
jgi:exonuclease VII small subunit